MLITYIYIYPIYNPIRFPPYLFVKIVFLQQLCENCFQCERAAETTTYGKRQISRTKLLNPLQSIFEEILHCDPNIFLTTTRSQKMSALLWLRPVKLLFLYLGHFAAPNP